MVRIVIDISKSLERNAEVYFEKAKKARKKIGGAKETVEKIKKKIEELKKKEKQETEKKQKQEKLKQRKKHWYEKFRWFVTSDNFFVIGGRDATSNEIVIKKHTDPDDLVLHTDMAGSPFFVIKSAGKKITKKAIAEAADADCSFSRAWKLGLTTQSVFYVKPEQVTKKTKPGEYLPKGAFMIMGKTNYIDNKINCAVGSTKEGAIMAGPVEAVKKHCKKYVELQQGNEKTSKIAKQIQHKIGGDLDEIIRAMPTGGVKVKK
jgi:predicted ribosome quality control (RQC) complex YloA/Tae2 family protein